MSRRFLIDAKIEIYVEAEDEATARSVASTVLEKKVEGQEWGFPPMPWGTVNSTELTGDFVELDEEGEEIPRGMDAVDTTRIVVRDERD